jgi:cephalosporin hydroxylase
VRWEVVVNTEIANEPALIRAMQADQELRRLRQQILLNVARYRYAYNFSWCGRPVIQLPEDLIALQEIVWRVRPDLIIETGVAHGGSLVFYASLLEMLGGGGQVVGVDVALRPRNRQEIERHTLAHRITLVDGSSVADEVVRRVQELARGRRQVLVVLDSNHTHAHVLRELELYAPLVTRGSYLVVLDTVIADLPAECFPDRPWGPGDNPKVAVQEFLRTNHRFRIDADIQDRLLISSAPDGYLLCVED